MTSSLTVQSPAQGRGELPDLEGGVAQGGALAARHRLHGVILGAGPRDGGPPTRYPGAECRDPHLELHRCAEDPDRPGTLPPGRAPPERVHPHGRVPRARGGDPPRAVGLHALDPRQRALRRPDRRRRVGARLGHRQRRAAGLRHRGPPPPVAGRRSSPCSSGSRSCARSASSPGDWAPASCSTGCRPPTAARSPASTSGCRCRGTSATRPASCSPTPTPTSRPPWHRSLRCRWRSARSR